MGVEVRKYMEHFVKLKCAPDLLQMKLFPNAKEISESMGAFEAVTTHVLKGDFSQFGDKNTVMICVGDGVVPRTGALFKFRTSWNCISIDPEVRLTTEWEEKIKGLTVIKKRLEEMGFDYPENRVIVVMVHSHARIKDVFKHIKAKELHIVSIPCCIPHDLDGIPYIGIHDSNIWSEKNTVKIWLNCEKYYSKYV